MWINSDTQQDKAPKGSTLDYTKPENMLWHKTHNISEIKKLLDTVREEETALKELKEEILSAQNTTKNPQLQSIMSDGLLDIRILELAREKREKELGFDIDKYAENSIEWIAATISDIIAEQKDIENKFQDIIKKNNPE